MARKTKSTRNTLVPAATSPDERRRAIRRESDAALLRSEEFFRALIENSLDAIAVVNAEGILTYQSPSFERLLGHSLEDHIGTSGFKFVHPEDMPKTTELFAQLVQNPGGVVHHELRTQHKDGSWRSVELLGRNHLDDPAVGGIVVNFHDITERKQAEDALRCSEEYFRSLIEDALDAVVVLNSDATIRYISPSYERVLGFTVGETIAESGFKHVHPDDVQDAAEKFARLLQEPSGTMHTEIRSRHKDGSWRVIEVLGRNLLDDPVVSGIVATFRDVTEHKRMEEALRENEEQFRMLAESSLIGVFIFQDMKFRYVNPIICKTLGYTTDEIVGKLGPLDLTYPEDHLASENYIRTCFSGQTQNTPLVCRGVCKNGDIIDCEVLATSVSYKGEPAVIGTFSEITERKKAEKALQESEERLKRYLDYSPDVICVVDIGGTILYANATTRKLIGYSSEELMGQNFLELGLLAPSDASKPTRWLAAGGAEKPSNPNEFELVGKDGRRIIAEVLTIPLGPAPGGYKTEIIAIARDITERKQMHESLRESEERFRAITETANDAILAINAKGIIVLWNHAAEAIFGYSATEAMGKPLTLMIPKRFRKTFQMGMKHQVSTENSTIRGKPIELIGMRKDGSEFPIEVTTSCWTAKGETFFTAVARDITERKRIEQQLLLSGRLASVGQLAAGVAHELNNPLTAVQAYAQFLAARDDLEETLKSDVETIYKEAQRATRITANLLSFARKREPEKSFISINDLIEESLELHAYRMNVNNIEVSMELEPDLPMTMADFYQLQQVFVNLITNAEQAITEAHGKGKLSIKTRKVGEMIQATFTDDGPGMPEDDLKRIFDPFFTTKDVGQGTGLGLSICYGIVQEHGGNLYARSKPGKGTTFVVEIPVISENQAIAEQTDSVQIEQA